MEEINTGRLLLRQWKIEDCDDLYEYGKDEEVGPNAGWRPHKSVEESQKIIEMFIRNNDSYAIVLKEENKVIGGIGLHNKRTAENVQGLRQREIGYVLNPKYWGNGYVPEAVESLLAYGFNKMNLDLIWCGHYDYNYKSKRVNEKCGFNYKFTRKEKLVFFNDREVKVLYYNMSKEEYMERKIGE